MGIITDSVTPLQIGDTIPEYLWHLPLQVVNHPGGKETITLDEYRGKLIILDFWATWCTACIQSMPKAATINHKYDDVNVILATREQAAKAKGFFAKRVSDLTCNGLTSIVNDSLLADLFPHRLIPHVVWIDSAGRLSATTGAQELTAANVAAYLANGDAMPTSKIDIDTKQQLFLDRKAPLNQIQHYSIFLKGRIPGLPSGNIQRKTAGITYGRAIMNFPLLMMYEVIVGKLAPEYNRKRLINQGIDNALIDLPENLSEAEKDAWNDANLYTYEFNLPIDRADALYRQMLEDLNAKTGYYGRIEKRTTRCLMLVRTSDADKLKAKGGPSVGVNFDGGPIAMKNNSLLHIVNLLNNRREIDLPIIDSTGYQGMVDLRLSGGLDIPSLRKDLNRYDLDLVEQQIPLDVFVLSKN
ncbi:TlpA family protein disulfide reductase [Parapedobacter deserti]|uniref:TlpA family protein disulfide reductase n=1 Tax=Parapedobacter deserti TaxID=1912957 RepID=A0ABV7JPF0_9SPHI